MRVPHASGPLLAACLLLAAPPARAEEERPLPHVELLAAGDAPRRVLRMTPEPGRAQILAATVTLGQKLTVDGRPVPSQDMPALRMRLEVVCSERRADGDYVLRFVFRKIDLAPDSNVPAPVRARFERTMARFDGVTLVVRCNERGMERATTVELPDYYPPGMEHDLDVLKRSFEDWSHPLPDAEVGVGARWRVEDVNDSEGWALHQTTTYALKRLDAEGFEVAIVIEQTADEQPMPGTGLPPGASSRLLGCQGHGTGRYVQRFGEVVPRELGMDLASVLNERATDGSTTRLLRQDVRLRTDMRSGAPGAAPTPERWEAPSAEDALAVMRRVMAHVEAGELDRVGAYVDGEALLSGMFPEQAASMPDAARRELLALLTGTFPRRALAFPQIHDGLANKEITLGPLEALPPRRDRILVRCRITHPRGETEVGWVLHVTPEGPRIVDALTDAGTEVGLRREAYAMMSTRTGESPLVWMRRALGVEPPPGSADTQPPRDGRPEWASSDALALGIRPPVLAKAPRDVACGPLEPSPWLERITLHVTSAGDVFFRPQGRASHLSRVTLATASPAEQELGLRQLQSMLVDATSRPATRREDGVSRHRLLLRADARCRWQHVAWLARLARDATVGIADVDLAVDVEGGGYGVVPLAPGEHEAPAGASVVRFLVRDTRDGRGVTRLELPGGATVELPHVPDAEATAETRAAYRAALASLRTALAAAGAKRWHVAFPLPFGPRVPCEDVVRLLRMLGDLGAEGVSVEPAWLPWEDDALEEPEGER